jgi:RNA polymerase sigma-70 factor (ECF subfamily)
VEVTADAGAQALAEVVRREWPRLVATLVRVTGDLTLAEDAAQDAAEQALEAWSTNLPDRPAAWILTVAKRRAIDRIRREATGRRKRELLGRLEAWDQQTIDDPSQNLTGLETTLHDDQLRLIFGCCHPALGIEAQIALTLRSVGGLTTPEIASAFLVSESTMAQRIVRAKRKIATAAIPFVLPPDSELLERLAVVHRVLYLVFNEGYAASGGDNFVRTDLCDEAIRLARLLADLVPDDAETLSLIALMLSTHARSAARVDEHGVPILLPEQDRSLWNHSAIDESRDYLDRSLRLSSTGPTQVQAAISQLHCEARTADATDWAQITLLYQRLEQLTPTPVVQLNRAVAVAIHEGPQVGLELLDSQMLATQLSDYRYYHAARADLLARLGRLAEARTAYDQAIAAEGPAGEVVLLRRKRDHAEKS